MPADLRDLPDRELVIHLEPGGVIRLVAEPVNRRLGRGEALPEVRLNAEALFNEGVQVGNKEISVSKDIDGKMNKVLTKVAIAHDEGSPAFYYAKATLMKAIKEVFSEKEDSK